MAISAVSRVADLADEHDGRVLAQDRTQTGREGETDLGIHLDLSDARLLDLDRVFDGNDVLVGLIDPRDRRVKGGRLAAAGRPGDQEDAVGSPDHPFERAELGLAEADGFEVQQGLGVGQQAHDQPFAVGHGNRR